MSQANLFPVKLDHQEQIEGTADLRLIGYTKAKVKYAVKRESDAPLLPLSEWIGHHISRLCGINTPDFDIIECIDGELAFGSRWEENSITITRGMPVIDSLILLQNHSEVISGILGLDGFLPNPDRHAGNFLFLSRGGQEMCLSMDFSCSNVRNGLPFGIFPLHFCNTKQLTQLLINSNKFSVGEFQKIVQLISLISVAQISGILNAAPNEWFNHVGRQDILDWWTNFSGARSAQVQP